MRTGRLGLFSGPVSVQPSAFCTGCASHTAEQALGVESVLPLTPTQPNGAEGQRGLSRPGLAPSKSVEAPPRPGWPQPRGPPRGSGPQLLTSSWMPTATQVTHTSTLGARTLALSWLRLDMCPKGSFRWFVLGRGSWSPGM